MMNSFSNQHWSRVKGKGYSSGDREITAALFESFPVGAELPAAHVAGIGAQTRRFYRFFSRVRKTQGTVPVPRVPLVVLN